MNQSVIEYMENTDADQKAVFSISESWAEAMITNDADAIGGFMTDDWRMVSKFGVSKKADLLALIVSGELTHSSFELRELSGIQIIRGETAVLTGRVTNTASFRGQSFEADEWTTDIFVRTSEGWKCVVTHITDVVARPNEK